MTVEEAFDNFRKDIAPVMDKLGFQAYGLGYNAAVEMIDEMSNAKHNQGDTIAAEVLRWAAKELRGENDA